MYSSNINEILNEYNLEYIANGADLLVPMVTMGVKTWYISSLSSSALPKAHSQTYSAYQCSWYDDDNEIKYPFFHNTWYVSIYCIQQVYMLTFIAKTMIYEWMMPNQNLSHNHVLRNYCVQLIARIMHVMVDIIYHNAIFSTFLRKMWQFHQCRGMFF